MPPCLEYGLFVGMYVSWRLFINVFHSVFSVCGGVVMYSFCRPIKAMSLLKSPHTMCMWFGWLVICCVILCCMIGMYLISSSCDGMYMCIIDHGCSGWLFISIICRYGDSVAGVGIFVMLPRNAYVLCMSVRSPPLAGVYGILCCMHLVSACVLLNISLYCGNRFCMYFVDFVAVSLVSCIVIIAGLFDISLCKFGRAVFRDEAFHVIICVL